MWKSLILISLFGSVFIIVSAGNSEVKSNDNWSTSSWSLEMSTPKNTQNTTVSTTEKSHSAEHQNKSAEISSNESTESTENSSEYSTEKAKEKATEKSTIKPTWIDPTEKTTKTSTDAENVTNKNGDKFTRNTTYKPMKEVTETSTENIMKKCGHKIAEYSTRQTTMRPNIAEHRKCAENEKFEPCPNKVRDPQTCEHLGFPYEDYDEDNEEDNCSGQGACICEEEYVRNRHGVCMPAENCPSCGGDKNATLGCGMNCGRRCSDYMEETLCLEVCLVNRCECKDNYVLDDFTGKCVLPKDCSRKNTSGNTKKACSDCNSCNKNEEYQKKYNCCKSLRNNYDSSEEDDNSVGDDDDNNKKCSNKDNTGMSTTTQKPTSSSKCFEEALRFFIPANIAFGGKLLKELMRLHPTRNVMFSSPAILYVLAQLAVPANGDAYTQILTALNFNNVELIKCFYKRIIPIALNIPDVEYELVGKIYSDNECPLTRDFRKETKNIFTFEPKNVDFQNHKSANIINEEIAEQTNNRIVDYIKPRLLSRLKGLVMVTAEYFEGRWQKQFDPLQTQQRDFYAASKTIKLNTMYQKNKFLYTESSTLDAKIVKMEYTGKEFTLAIILPNRNQGLRDVVNKILQPDLIMSALDSLKMETVEIYLPIFNLTVANRLREPLGAANITKIFQNQTAGLEDITWCNGTYVSDILQKSTLQIDEFGAGNSKITDFDSEEMSPQEDNRRSYTFRADHPFLVALIYQKIFVYIGAYIHEV